MTQETLLLPRVAPALVSVLNRLYGGERSLAFRAGGHEWRFQPDGGVLPATWRVRVYARLGDYDLAVFLDSLILADWEGSGLSLPTLAALPPELAGAALELVCRDLAETLEGGCGFPVSVSGLNLDEEEAWLPEEGFAFSLVRDDGQTVRGAVAAARECLEFLADLFTAHAAGQGRHVSSLFIRPRIVLPGPDLSARELSGLEAGDILLTATASGEMETGLPVRLAITPTCAAPARLEGALLHLEGYMTQETPDTIEAGEFAAQENPDGPEAEEGAVPQSPPSGVVSAEDLPLTVAFDLGGAELTVAEAAALAPGQVLATGRDTTAPVVITVAGRAVGTGSLVDVAGRIGVRVETLSLGQG